MQKEFVKLIPLGTLLRVMLFIHVCVCEECVNSIIEGVLLHPIEKLALQSP